MAKPVELKKFLQVPGCIFDVRSPGEFGHGRLPEAYSLALFSDSERARIGTTYKQIGRKQAVLEGMQFAAPKFTFLVEEIEKILALKAPAGAAKIHCWRGGMRSGSVAMLLEMAGIPTVTLQGGYKAYRRWVLEFLNMPLQLHVIGGMTGCGKTAILKCLYQQGAQVLDLEGLVNHRGSSFGMLGLSQQPSNEQLENEIASKLATFDLSKPIWLEDESRLIGYCKIPDPLFSAMCSSPLYFVERNLEERLANIQQTYWSHDPMELIAATKRLTKKLGSVRTKEITTAIENNDLRSATLMLLEYYDASYQHEMKRHTRTVHLLKGSRESDEAWAAHLMTM